jgi:hypothetical protein
MSDTSTVALTAREPTTYDGNESTRSRKRRRREVSTDSYSLSSDETCEYQRNCVVTVQHTWSVSAKRYGAEYLLFDSTITERFCRYRDDRCSNTLPRSRLDLFRETAWNTVTSAMHRILLNCVHKLPIPHDAVESLGIEFRGRDVNHRYKTILAIRSDANTHTPRSSLVMYAGVYDLATRTDVRGIRQDATTTRRPLDVTYADISTCRQTCASVSGSSALTEDEIAWSIMALNGGTLRCGILIIIREAQTAESIFHAFSEAVKVELDPRAKIMNQRTATEVTLSTAVSLSVSCTDTIVNPDTFDDS